jgi:repressor LexA
MALSREEVERRNRDCKKRYYEKNREVLLQKAKEAKNGQIVVARLGDDVTVKRLRRTSKVIELIPENPDFQTILVPLDAEDFELEGIAVGLIRNTMLM